MCWYTHVTIKTYGSVELAGTHELIYNVFYVVNLKTSTVWRVLKNYDFVGKSTWKYFEFCNEILIPLSLELIFSLQFLSVFKPIAKIWEFIQSKKIPSNTNTFMLQMCSMDLIDLKKKLNNIKIFFVSRLGGGCCSFGTASYLFLKTMYD